MSIAARRVVLAASAVLCVGATAAGPPVVVFPAGPSVPENLLRIELRFALPLRAPLNVDHVKLLADDGQQIEDAFLDLPLSSADGKRVTLLLHPGRVKSGVGANLLLGRALKAGSPVALVVDDPAIGPPIRKSWQVVAPDTLPPVPASWTLSLPAAGGRLPLTVHLEAPIGSSSESLIAVRGADGKRLDGAVALSDSETSWQFVPTRPWRAGRYALVTHADLEDEAGNRACAVFEMPGASRANCETGTVTFFSLGVVRVSR